MVLFSTSLIIYRYLIKSIQYIYLIKTLKNPQEGFCGFGVNSYKSHQNVEGFGVNSYKSHQMWKGLV